MSITNGYCTLAEFKAAKNIASTNAGDDAVIEDMIEAASRYIDRKTDRTFYARTETRYYSIPEHNDQRLILFDDDLLTLTSLTNGDGTAVQSTDYILLPRNDTPKYGIRLRDSSDVIWEVDSNSSDEYVIAVEGTWGYSASAPDDIKELTVEIARNLYLARRGEGGEVVTTITAAGVVVTPKALPTWGADLLKHYTRLI